LQRELLRVLAATDEKGDELALNAKLGRPVESSPLKNELTSRSPLNPLTFI